MPPKPTCYPREKVKPGVWRRRSPKTGEWDYEITYRDSDGRQRRQRVKGGMRDAETALSNVKAEIGKGRRVAPNHKLTFRVAAAEWLEAKSPNLSPRTIAAYRYALDTHLLPEFGRRRLSDIDVRVVAKFVARMATAEYRRSVQRRTRQAVNATGGYSVQTIKSTLIPLSRTFAYSRRHLDFPGDNAVTALDDDERPGYRQHKPTKRKLNRAQLDRLVDAAASPWREIIATALALGTRLGETLGLEWRHIDLAEGTIRIEQQATRYRTIARVKTRAGIRTIEAPDWLIAMLRDLKERTPFGEPTDYVFPTLTGKLHGQGNVYRGLRAAIRDAGLPVISFHSLRHTHASLWIKEGGEVVTLSKRLGHATPQVTMTVYADEIEEANDGAARRAQANQLFAGTKLAAFLAARDPDHALAAARPTVENGALLPYTRGRSMRSSAIPPGRR